MGQKATDLTLTDEPCWGQSLPGDSCPNPHNLFSHMHVHTDLLSRARLFHHQVRAEYLLSTFVVLCGKRTHLVVLRKIFLCIQNSTKENFLKEFCHWATKQSARMILLWASLHVLLGEEVFKRCGGVRPPSRPAILRDQAYWFDGGEKRAKVWSRRIWCIVSPPTSSSTSPATSSVFPIKST